MSRGNIFVSPKTQHYFYIPRLEGYGLAYMDAYNFNMLANPQTPMARRYREVTQLSEVNIYNYGSFANFGIVAWLGQYVNGFRYQTYESDGTLVTRYLTMSQDLTGNPDNLVDLISYVESKSYKDRLDDLSDGDNRAVRLHDIQSSVDGYLSGYYTNSAGNSIDNGCKAYFPQPWANQTNRSAAIKGSTLFSAVPRRSSGAKYHYRESLKQDQGKYTGDGAGLSNEDHSATVAGPLKLKWNPIQNVWEAGNTFLATLLTDVDGANIQKTGITQDNIYSRASDEFYSSDGVETMSDFTTGLAMPVNLQAAHPKSFGPNLIKCGGGSANVETIRVVNRSRTNFSAGERVIVYQIDGENVIGKFTEETLEERAPLPGRWNFTKFMSNSDEYFRIDDGNNRGGISPEGAAVGLYAKYYNLALSSGKTDTNGALITAQDCVYNQPHEDNLPVPKDELASFKLFPYWQTHSIDQTESDGTPLWGNETHRINIEDDPTDSDKVGQENVLGEDMPLWFGPMFPDGMVSKSNFTGNSQHFPNAYKYDKLHMPADVAYPYFYNAHNSIYWQNLDTPAIFGDSGIICSSGIKQVNNVNRVQFSFLQPELMGCGDYATIQLPNTVGGTGRFGAANTSPRMFVAIAAKHASRAGTTDYDGGADQALLGRMFARRPNEIVLGNRFNSPVGPAQMYHDFDDPGDMANCFKYDAYIDYVPLNRPINAPGLFGGDTGPESNVTPGEEFFGGSPGIWVGANAVGITSARLSMTQGNGTSWTLACETNQTFGMKGRFFGGGGGGNIYATIIGGMMAFANDTRGRTIQGSVPMWGSTRDGIDSFGTGACHVQVWDAWPDQFTSWCPQYMFSLHTNPLATGLNPQTQKTISLHDPTSYTYNEKVINYANATKKANGDWENEPVDYFINVGYPSTMTFKEPTFGDTVSISAGADDENPSTYPSYGTGKDGQLVTAGTVVTSATKLRPKNLWYNNRSREGKLVSLYGYHHFRRTLGLKNNGTIVEKDDGFLLGDYKVGNGEKEAEIKIKENSVKINKATYSRNDGTEQDEYQRGAGYMPSDLPVSYTITDGLGKKCKISFPALECYYKHYHDQGPKPRSNLTRVSKSSTTGTDTTLGNKGTAVMVAGNKVAGAAFSPYPSRNGNILEGYAGTYEVLVYVHNDVSFTWINPPEPTTGYQFAQYITLSLG